METHITIGNRLLSYEMGLGLLIKATPLFTPLSETLDLELYARKLSDKASFVVCYSNKEIIGFIAYYLNAKDRQVYITLICVDEGQQTHGIGSKMLEFLVSKVKQSDIPYDSIALEVNKQNNKAYNFYIKHEFVEQEDRGKKLLMVKRL